MNLAKLNIKIMPCLNETAFNFLRNFLMQNSHIDNFDISAIQGDAGFRSYYRISTKSPVDSNSTSTVSNYIFMDCPPSYTPIKPFIEVANYINSTPLKAPQIYAYDELKGHILLEDFGNISGRDFLESLLKLKKDKNKDTNDNPDINKRIEDFYKVAIDILVELQNNFNSENSSGLVLKNFSDELLIKELDVFLEWYIKIIGKGGTKGYLNDKKISDEFVSIWHDLLAENPNLPDSILLRDYHVENMMMLETDSISVSSIGLLDFQDSLRGSPVYDLVSLLEDARIKVSRELALKMIKYFAEKKSMNLDDVIRQYHILGAQRNLRILGVFARKSLRDKDDRYLAYMTRMIQYIGYDLSLPASDSMKKLKIWLKTYTDITF